MTWSLNQNTDTHDVVWGTTSTPFPLFGFRGNFRSQFSAVTHSLPLPKSTVIACSRNKNHCRFSHFLCFSFSLSWHTEWVWIQSLAVSNSLRFEFVLIVCNMNAWMLMSLRFVAALRKPMNFAVLFCECEGNLIFVMCVCWWWCCEWLCDMNLFSTKGFFFESEKIRILYFHYNLWGCDCE